MYATLATGTPYEDPDEPGASLTIAKNATVGHRQHGNESYSESSQIFYNAATVDEALKHQGIETTEKNYITELCKKI